jgi:hypothetical protein
MGKSEIAGVVQAISSNPYASANMIQPARRQT